MAKGREIFALAKWEVLRSGKGANRKFVLLFLGAAIILTLLVLSFNGGRFGVAQGLYRVAVVTRNYDALLKSEPRLEPIYTTEEDAVPLLRSGKVDLVLLETGVFFDGEESRSVAAMGIFRDAVKASTEAELVKAAGNDRSLRFTYFPVWVRVSFTGIQRTSTTTVGPALQGSQQVPENAVTENTGEPPAESDVQVTVAAGRPSQDEAVTPSNIAPPLPFFSTLATVALLCPTFFLSQAYGNSLIRERVRARGRILLLSPLRPASILLGKGLPYVLTSLALTLFIAVSLKSVTPYRAQNPILLDATLVSLLVLPASLMFFSIAVVSSLLFKDFRESSIVMVLLHTILAVYLVTPASIPVILPVSVASPITPALSIIDGGSPSLVGSVAPVASFFLLAAMVFFIGSAAFNEESLFTEKRLTDNILDSLDRLTTRPIVVMLISSGLVLFTIIAELLAVTVTILLVRTLAILPILVILSAVIEEGLKGLPTYVMFSRGKVPRNTRAAFRLALYTAVGFFAAEKALFLGFTPAVAGFLEVLGLGFGGLLVIPLLIHFGSSFVFASGAARLGRNGYWGALPASAGLHAGLNFVVIWLILRSAGVSIG